MKRDKRSVRIEIIFLVLCSLLLLEMGFLLYILMNPEKNIGGFTGFAISEERVADNLRFVQSECIQELGNSAMYFFGENKKVISDYIHQNIDECFNPSLEKYSKKYSIQSSLESIYVSFGGNSTKITTSFPILINHKLFNETLEVKL